MAQEERPIMEFEDIQSDSRGIGRMEDIRKGSAKKRKGTVRHLDRIVKAIAFLVALFILLLFAAGAFLLYKMEKSFAMIALCILIAGLAFALIALFLIYAIGHIITQNSEIIKRL